jgi:hypothetical protein
MKLPDILESINVTKKDLSGDEVDFESGYVAFVVNRCLSYYPDLVLSINLINGFPQIPKQMQYHFLLHYLKKHKRYGKKWVKPEITEELELVKEYYGYSTTKAEEALSLLNKDQINQIKQFLDKGGKVKKS